MIPGYCVAGTVGHKVLSGQKKIELDKKSVVSSVCYMKKKNALKFIAYCEGCINYCMWVIRGLH